VNAWLRQLRVFALRSSRAIIGGGWPGPLLQLRILGLGFLQDGDVGGGVFPEGEDILISGAGLGGVALHRIGSQGQPWWRPGPTLKREPRLSP